MQRQFGLSARARPGMPALFVAIGGVCRQNQTGSAHSFSAEFAVATTDRTAKPGLWHRPQGDRRHDTKPVRRCLASARFAATWPLAHRSAGIACWTGLAGLGGVGSGDRPGEPIPTRHRATGGPDRCAAGSFGARCTSFSHRAQWRHPVVDRQPVPQESLALARVVGHEPGRNRQPASDLPRPIAGARQDR